MKCGEYRRCTVKPITIVFDSELLYARVRHFHPSLKITGKARSAVLLGATLGWALDNISTINICYRSYIYKIVHTFA